MPGLGLLRFSLLRVQRRTAAPVVTEHVEKASEGAAQAQPPQTSRGARGRPTGSKNRHRREVALSPSRRFLPEPIQRLLRQLGEAVKVVYGIVDGELGQHAAMPRVRQVGRHWVAKLRDHAALSFPSAGP